MPSADPSKPMFKSEFISAISILGVVLFSGATPLNAQLDIGDIWFIGDSITQSNADGLPSSGGSAATDLYRDHSGTSASVIGNNLGTRVGMTQNMDSGQNFWNTGRLVTVKPEIILIIIGTNDVVQEIDLANAPAKVSAMVDKIMSLSGAGTPAIFIATIPPNRGNRARIINVRTFNAALPDVVAAQRLAGRDIYPVDTFTVIDDDYANAMRPDNLHPNSVGNDHIGQAWFDALMH